MEWQNLYTPKRTGISKKSQTEDSRTAYQRDFDRLIFSSAFRRLQDKTQVFPLPGSTFVHNRLTHSLEVASVGRSLGADIGEYIADLLPKDEKRAKQFYLNDLSNIIAAGCLANDIGNPAFGHSGEDAISNYFSTNHETQIGDRKLVDYFNDAEWADLTNFEGNANALRVLAQNFKGKIQGGLGLTYTTLAAIFKYPCGSIDVDKTKKHRKKYSFFQSEKDIFDEVVQELDFVKDNSAGYGFRRHPFVYLVEAADDICYTIIDMEDAHRLKIISKAVTEEAFWAIIEELDHSNLDLINSTYANLEDDNAAVSYLRAKCIGLLTKKAASNFIENSHKILNATFDSTLVDLIEKESEAIQNVQKISVDKIYNHDSVVEIEIAGYNVMSELLGMYIPAILKSNPSAYDKQVLKLIPNQFDPKQSETAYLKVMNVLDHVSSMTDVYATDFYRKVKGIEISKHA